MKPAAAVLGLASALGLFSGCTKPDATAELPDWAYPVVPPQVPQDAVIFKHLPGSLRHYTMAQIEDRFNPPDWYPNAHPAMPGVVGTGRPPGLYACSLCHLTNGAHHRNSSGRGNRREPRPADPLHGVRAAGQPGARRSAGEPRAASSARLRHLSWPELKGVGEIPSLLGQSPIYLYRQLNDLQHHARHGAMSSLMQPIVAGLNTGDMVAIAAYLASCAP